MAIPIDLESYQQDLSPNTLYYAKNSGRGGSPSGEREDSGIIVVGGTVDIYGSLHKPSSPPADMALDRVAFQGLDVFEWIPTYIYIVVNSGTPVITVSSIEVQEVV